MLETSNHLPQESQTAGLLPLDVGKPEAYENWRRSAQAAVACRAGVDPVAMEYIAEIDNQQRLGAQLAGAFEAPGSRAASKAPRQRVACARCPAGGAPPSHTTHSNHYHQGLASFVLL